MAVRHSGLIWALPCPSAQAAAVESAPSLIGRITLGMKRAGVRSAGNPHAAYDVAGVGNGVTGRIEAPADGESCRQQLLPVPTATAPALDPTGGRRLEKCSIIRVTRWPPTLRHDQFGGGPLEKGPKGTSLAAYPTVRAVLRGGGDSDVISLPDRYTTLQGLRDPTGLLEGHGAATGAETDMAMR